ncbi:O-antigen ligase RfaL [Jejubacter calystegiae]|uniref:O-antigen ligase RfaL n=1 Tax=Jejubacter calystegiae TaxID=2579935 RepID=UPI00143CF3B7|nr:O-antigen ligase RfaL [Jejubacter calystegiae]
MKKQSLWNLGLVFLYIVTYFIDGITRYKNALPLLMLITAIIYLVRNKKIIRVFFNKIMLMIILLCISMLYSLIFSTDIKISWDAMKGDMLTKGFLLSSLLIPIVLFYETKERIIKLVIISFISALSMRMAIEGYIYFLGYQHGIIPFESTRYRNVSDALVFLFPGLIPLWHNKRVDIKAIFILLTMVFCILCLGTLARGAWLATIIMGLIWLIAYREWKLITLSLLLTFAGFIAIQNIQPQYTTKLLNKIHQTDSSARYRNGTQGTALELIMEKPVVGYGYGKNIFHNIYNERVKDHPNWIFKHSIGPHNIYLDIWFGCGVIGLMAFLGVIIVVLTTLIKSISRTTDPDKMTYLMLTVSFFGFYIIRGMFELVDIKPLGILIGLLLIMRYKNQKN